MKTKLIFTTNREEVGRWIDLPFIPRVNEWLNVVDILGKEELAGVYRSATCWSTSHGSILSVEYRRNDEGFYAEVIVWCED